METEQETDEFAGFTFPLTSEQLVELEPKLMTMACRFTYCESTKRDYVQVAYLALIDGGRKWTNPEVAAYSAMQDYQRGQAVRGRVSLFATGEDEGEFDVHSGMPNWAERMEETDLLEFRGLGLRELDRQMAVMYFVEKLQQKEITAKTGVGQSSFFNAMNRVKAAIKAQWIGCKDEEEEETECSKE